VTGGDGSGDTRDQIRNSVGSALAARVTGLPICGDEGRRLFHLGLSYTYQFLDDQESGAATRVRAYPETRLGTDRFVDTGDFVANGADLFAAEAAVVLGSLSIQGELFWALFDASSARDPGFWGGYLYGSYFLTGEHRPYDKGSGVFSRVRPLRDFAPWSEVGGWGAWEMGLRLSHVDLNDGDIRGGREINFTAGLNWYLNPHVRFTANYVLALVDDRSVPAVDSSTCHTALLRFQLAF
jgi:phosphate-selective porin OprO/OprP